MNRQYPKKAATLVTNRGMFLANCTKHVIFDLVKFNPGKFFIPCLLKSTDTRLFVLLFFSYLKSYFLRLFEPVSYSFPYARFSRGRRNSSCATFRTPRISRHFQQKQACKGYISKVKTRLHTLTPAAEKHCDNLRYFSVLYSMRAIYTRSYKAKKIIAHHKFYSSSWTSELQVSVVRVQNLVVSDERTRERFFP